jgi:flavin-dependent dehydrogenase
MEPGVSTSQKIVVIGAGPAGAIAAGGLAQRGLDVLLVDRAVFPRDKVCGCCLNRRALATLAGAGLGGLPRRLGGRTIDHLVVSAGRAATRMRVPAGIALSRRRFDQALVEAAVAAGARFADGVSARVVEAHEHAVRVSLAGDILEAGLVLAADGLAGRSLDGLTGFVARIRAGSRIGAALLVDAASAPPVPAGAIRMACGVDGYVGMVSVEDGRTNVAAALDPRAVRARGGPGPTVGALLEANAMTPTPALTGGHWHGTAALTRRRRVAGPRVFVLGDAAGYVEPFTGEGMAWALAGGHAVVDAAHEAIRQWRPELADRWRRAHRRVVGRRQGVCRAVARMLRHPRATRACLGALRAAPWLAAPVLHQMTAPMFPRPAAAGG